MHTPPQAAYHGTEQGETEGLAGHAGRAWPTRRRSEVPPFSPTFFEEWYATIGSIPDDEKGGSDMDSYDGGPPTP
jgi:hypothetical protein